MKKVIFNKEKEILIALVLNNLRHLLKNSKIY